LCLDGTRSEDVQQALAAEPIGQGGSCPPTICSTEIFKNVHFTSSCVVLICSFVYTDSCTRKSSYKTKYQYQIIQL